MLPEIRTETGEVEMSGRSRTPPAPPKPTVARLRDGAALRSIVHAVFISRAPDFAHEVSWDGTNYSRQNSAGARGTVTFSSAGVVGAFFDQHSAKSPFRKASYR